MFTIELVGDEKPCFVTGYNNKHGTPDITENLAKGKTWTTEGAAHDWAASYLCGYSYRVVPV